MFLAINMGASGTAPSFSAAYGANLIRKDLIPGLFGLFVFLGALIGGKEVSATIGKAFLDPGLLNIEVTTVILASISLSLFIANLLGVPQSTSQSTVFAILGVALYLKELHFNGSILKIIGAWFYLPIIAFLMIFFIGKFFYKIIKRSRWFHFEEIQSDKKLKFLVIVASCYVAFSIGANNVANASGLITSMIIKELNLEATEYNFLLITIVSTLLIAPCFGIGSSLLGSKNLETTGKKIVTFGPLGAMLVATITATLLITVSFLGMPASEVQLSTGAIIGLGICKVGFKGIMQRDTIKKIGLVWMVSPLVSFLVAFLLMSLLAFVKGIL